MQTQAPAPQDWPAVKQHLTETAETLERRAKAEAIVKRALTAVAALPVAERREVLSAAADLIRVHAASLSPMGAAKAWTMAEVFAEVESANAANQLAGAAEAALPRLQRVAPAIARELGKALDTWSASCTAAEATEKALREEHRAIFAAGHEAWFADFREREAAFRDQSERERQANARAGA
jgi:hypothetical protein